jgi:hypothetical protein
MTRGLAMRFGVRRKVSLSLRDACGGRMGWILLKVSAVLLISLVCSTALAQGLVGAEMAYKNAVQNTSLFEDMLEGETINLFDRKLNWSALDVSVPGNGPTIEVARSHRSSPGGWFDVWRGDMYNWELDVPRISIAMSLYGTEDNHTISLLNGCPMGGIGTSVPGRPRYVNIRIRGAGDFRPISMNPAVSYPLLSARPPHAHFNNNWLLYCDSEFITRSASTNSFGAPLAKPSKVITLVSPDGTKYHFAYASTEKPAVNPSGPKDPDDPEWGTVIRGTLTLYVTDIEDRFGNHLTYDYERRPDNNAADVLRLKRIRASDGRDVLLAYRTDDHGQTGVPGSGRHLQSVTYGDRTWVYTYQNGDLGQPRLARVTDSAGLYWDYQYYPLMQGQAGRDHVFRITTPLGATIEYDYEYLYSLMGGNCQSAITVTMSRLVNGSIPQLPIPNVEMHPAVSRREVKVNGVTVSRDQYSSSLAQDTQDPNRYFVVTDILRTASREKFYHACYTQPPPPPPPLTAPRSDARQLAIIKHETFGGPNLSTLVRSVDTEWRSIAYSGNYRVSLGRPYFQSNDRLSVSKVTTTLGTDQFVRSYDAPDILGHPTSIFRSNTLGHSRSDSVEYHHDSPLWVVGQQRRSTAAGIEISKIDYGWNALPWKTYSFGKLDQTFSYETTVPGQIGTLKSVADGNGNVTTLTDWKRGIPQLIAYADGTSKSALVDDNGWISWVVDESESKICYQYDAIGRLTKVTYPSETQANTCNSSKWAETNQEFDRVSTAELGVPAGYWRQTLSTGNGRSVTYRDGLWRPVLMREYDTTSEAGTQRFTRQTYDHEGRVIFASYPGATHNLSIGIHTTYDALDRVTHVNRDWEGSGQLTTSTQYLSGLQIRTTNPRGHQTTTRFLAWDEPIYDFPVQITHPAGAYTHIFRDPIGKPTRLRRSNSGSPTDGTFAVDRRYYYDSHHRLCRSMEPEAGSTVMQYDAADNLAWSAAGLSLPSTEACYHAQGQQSGRRVNRTYDVRNRLTTLSFPDGRGNQVWAYTPSGLPSSISTYNSNGSGLVTNSYAYNRRQLLVGEVFHVDSQLWNLSYSYNALGHLSDYTTPGLAVDLAPNALGQPTRAGVYAGAVSYFPNGAVKQFTYGNGIKRTLTQNGRGLPDTGCDFAGAGCTASAVLRDSYDYDQHGNVVAITDGRTGSRGNRDMTYDALDRLAQAVSPMFGTANYSYDVLDNLRTVQVGTGPKARNHTYVYDANNQLTNVTLTSGGATVMGLGYDLQGNLANKNGLIHVFDYGNRLREVTGVEQYRYDGYGRRVLAIRGGQNLYSVYGYDGSLRFQRDERTGKTIDYVHLGGNLVAQVENALSLSTPSLSAPATNTTGSYTVTWTTAAMAVRYQLQERKGNDAWVMLHDAAGNSKDISGKSTGDWSYQARACSATTCGSWSPIVTTAVSLTPGSTPTITAPATNATGSYTVSWTSVATATRYELEERLGAGAWSQIQDTSATSRAITGKATGSWGYRVRACNSTGCGEWSAIGSVSVILPPAGVPTLTAPSNAGSSYTVSWTSVTAAIRYELDESFNGGAWNTIYNGAGNSVSRTGGGVGSTLSYRVRACNDGGCGANSETKTVNIIPSGGPKKASLGGQAQPMPRSGDEEDRS